MKQETVIIYHKKQVPLYSRKVTTIGGSTQCSLQIHSVSKNFSKGVHALILWDEQTGLFVVRHIDPTTFTIANGIRLELNKLYKMKDLNKIQFGSVKTIVRRRFKNMSVRKSNEFDLQELFYKDLRKRCLKRQHKKRVVTWRESPDEFSGGVEKKRKQRCDNLESTDDSCDQIPKKMLLEPRLWKK